MASKANWVIQCTVSSVLLSLSLGIIATYSAYLQEDHFQHSEANNPWLYGIVINSGLAAVFIVPLGIIVGRVLQRLSDSRGVERNDELDDATSSNGT